MLFKIYISLFLTGTLCRPTETPLLHVADRLQLIVESELRVGWDILTGKEADPRVAVHRPLLGLAIGIARMVHETGHIS